MTYEEVRSKLDKKSHPVLDMIIVSAIGKKTLYPVDIDEIATMYYEKLKESK